jgi:hypothetical protein
LKLVLEPIFEADFEPVSYGFRPASSGSLYLPRPISGSAAGGTRLDPCDIATATPQHFTAVTWRRIVQMMRTRRRGPRI